MDRTSGHASDQRIQGGSRDGTREEDGLPKEQFRTFTVVLPKPVFENLCEAERKIARSLSMDVETKEFSSGKLSLYGSFKLTRRRLLYPPSAAGRARAAAGPTVRSKSAFELGLPWMGTC